MLPLHVALVPSDDANVDTGELLRVAAALQVQLTRDFEPVWGISAVVSPFTSLDQVPPACLPLVILPAGCLGPGGHAFHTTERGIPFGLVEYKDGWSLSASHELLEMVCDPQGKRRVMGDSIADSYLRDVDAAYQQYLPQGQVAYLLEICDPCQDVYYIVNGLQVSDFVFPRYYAPGDTQCGCYSFTGKIKRPRELLNGGYVTWYTSIGASPVWQAKRDRLGALTIGPMTIPASGSSRPAVDFTNEVFDSLGPSAPPTSGTAASAAPPSPPAPPAPAAALAARAAERYGAELRADLDRVLQDIYAGPPQDDLDQVISLLHDLVTNNTYYQDFATNPTFRSDELNNRLGHDVAYPHGVPTQPQLEAVYAKAQHLVGQPTGRKVSGKFAATMIQGQT